MQQAQRTQIYLPQELRKEIDRQRSLTGESLAEYLRQAAEARLKKDKSRKADLKKLADEVIGSLKGTIIKEEAVQWIKEIREDRRLADERLDKRWVKAHKKKHVSS